MTDPTPHVFRVSVYYEDTDFSGLVYHPNYLKKSVGGSGPAKRGVAP